MQRETMNKPTRSDPSPAQTPHPTGFRGDNLSSRLPDRGRKCHDIRFLFILYQGRPPSAQKVIRQIKYGASIRYLIDYIGPIPAPTLGR